MHILDWVQSSIQEAWTALSGIAVNALATATKAAVAGRVHVIDKVDASYSTSTTDGWLQVYDGSNKIAEKFIHGAGAVDFGFRGYPATKGNAISATLQASGSSGVSGEVTIFGFDVTPGAGDAV